ncbi:hypothetical protein [Enterobacter ludwigii]|uniref:hypothetical protein n=1 Tax=Enterobacter ludwigii TaxID=299767 RepID=UPI0013D0D8A5|nr:hypothetical protein [Enterobacter ludwigii]
MIKSVKIKKLHVALEQIRPDTFRFNCAGTIEGTLHITPSDTCQIELLGGYSLPENHCPACAMMSISELHFLVEQAEEAAGLNYATYRKVFHEGVKSILRH